MVVENAVRDSDTEAAVSDVKKPVVVVLVMVAIRRQVNVI